MKMKWLEFEYPHNLGLLYDELCAAIPELFPALSTDGRIDTLTGEIALVASMKVQGRGNTIILTVPEDTDEDAIQVVIEAHDSTVKQPDIRQDRHKLMAALVELDRVHPWTPEQLHEIVTLAIEELLT